MEAPGLSTMGEKPSPEETSTPLSAALVQQVEGLDANAPVALLRTIIERNKLPVSPGSGGVKRRTKFHMLQDIQVAVDYAGLSQAVCLLVTTLILGAAVRSNLPLDFAEGRSDQRSDGVAAAQ